MTSPKNYLFYDAVDPSKGVRFGLSSGAEWQFDVLERGSAHGPLALIDAFLKKNNLTIHDITGVAVRVGAGSFTAVRSSTVVANALGFAKNIPVVATDAEPASADQLFCSSPSRYALPRYSSPPRIGNAAV